MSPHLADSPNPPPVAAPSSRAAGRSLRIGLVGTYPPRACGLATFTADMAAALRNAGDVVVIAALVDSTVRSIDDVPGVACLLVQDDVASARSAAAWLSSAVDIVLVEHEFGIFGGRQSTLAAFTTALTVPYMLTLHTVLSEFTRWQRSALALPLVGATSVLVFSDRAVELLAAQFPDIESRCEVVPHAAPVEMFQAPTPDLRERLGLPERAKVVSTFGLLSPAKGIEHAIRAMPNVRSQVGDVVYVVAGCTHPEVVRRYGERYRNRLMSIARSVGVDDIVIFRNWFHDVDELSALLRTSDVFVTPYLNAEQIVSGALSFAVAAGLPFVSTPYRYAQELADAGCGLTVDFGDDRDLATAIGELLIDDDRRVRMARRSGELTASRSWPDVGSRMSGLLRRSAVAREVSEPLAAPAH